MNIRSLFICLPNLEKGGAEQVTINLLRNFDRSLFKITLVVLDNANGKLRKQVPLDVEILALNKTRVLNAIPKLIQILRNKKPDIVFSNLSHLNLALAISKPLLPKKIKLVARESNVVSINVIFFPFSKLFVYLYRVFYRNIDTIVCQSSEMADDLLNNFNVKQGNIRIINNPVDLDFIQRKAGSFKPSKPAKYVFVACGRLNFQKGFDLLLDAVADLKNIDWALWIIGEGKLKSKLKAKALKLNVQDRVKFLGYKENPYPYFSEADAFILSSRFEGMPNVVLEALAVGTMIISTPAPGGVCLLLNKSKCGILADDISSIALYNAIQTYLKNPEDYKIDSDLIKPYLIREVTEQFEQVMTVANK